MTDPETKARHVAQAAAVAIDRALEHAKDASSGDEAITILLDEFINLAFALRQYAERGEEAWKRRQ